MDFGLQNDIPGQALDEEWRALLARQARILEDMLTRVAKTVTAVNFRPDRTPVQLERLHDLLSKSEEFLTTMAQQYIGFERETAQFQAISAEPGEGSPETARQLRMLDQVAAALHANLTAARRYLADIRQTIERMTTGA